MSRSTPVTASRNIRVPPCSTSWLLWPHRWLAAAVFHQLYRIPLANPSFRPRHERPLDPMVDRGRVPHLLFDLPFFRGIAAALSGVGRLDLERFERPGVGRYGLLGGDLRCAGALEAHARRAVEVSRFY